MNWKEMEHLIYLVQLTDVGIVDHKNTQGEPVADPFVTSAKKQRNDYVLTTEAKKSYCQNSECLRSLWHLIDKPRGIHEDGRPVVLTAMIAEFQKNEKNYGMLPLFF